MCRFLPKCCRKFKCRNVSLLVNILILVAVGAIFTALGFQLERSIPCWQAQFTKPSFKVEGNVKKASKAISEEKEKIQEDIDKLCKAARNFAPTFHYVLTAAFFFIIIALLGHVLIKLNQAPRVPIQDHSDKKPGTKHCVVYVRYPCTKCGEMTADVRHVSSTTSGTYDDHEDTPTVPLFPENTIQKDVTDEQEETDML